MNKKKILIFSIIGVVVVALIITSILVINHINYTKTYEYKFNKIGYNKEEVIILKKELKDKQLDELLNHNYDKNITKLVKEKYFIFNKLDDYLKYYKDNKDKSLTDVVAIINTNTNNDFYTNTKETDVSKNELMLLNKYNYLTANYNPDDLVVFTNVYAYGENQSLRKDAYDAFIEMWNSANKDGYKLIVNSSYRSDKKAARAGYSEHQTGLAVDIQSYCSQNKDFEECEEFTWLTNNAYKYGFILRYPKDKEYLTGYKYVMSIMLIL